MTTRLDWDSYFLEIMNTVAKRATCNRGKSGCVIVRDNRMLVTGYVGSPQGFPHCDDVGHLMKQVTDENGIVRDHCFRTVHSEQNAICQAARTNISLLGSTIYCSMFPCRTCAMLIIQCGISRVVCEYNYQASDESIEMFKYANIEFLCMNPGKTKY